MVERIDIERALDDMVSNEDGMRFQNLAVVLAKQRWRELIACERHHDRGLDAYAPPLLAGDGIGRGLACSTSGEFTKLNSDAKTAKKNYSALSVLIFATLAKVTQYEKDQWREKVRSMHGMELDVLSREDIITELQLPANATICRAHLKLDVPYETPVGELLGHTREAAAAVTAEWAEHPRLIGQPQITLDVLALDEQGNESGDRFPTTDLGALLLCSRRLILDAPAGRGKTTTLVQVAQSASGGIPLLIELPAWVRSGKEILDYVAQQPAFRSRGITAEGLARLASAEPLLFLLNGWNEVAEAQAGDAMTALAELERAFPAAGILVATRAHHILPPLPGAARLQLRPLTPQQRLHYLRHALPTEQAQALHTKLIRDSVLDDLTRTPFILSEITNLARSGRNIPRTKLGVLAAVVALTKELEHHRGPLQGRPLMGRASAYLSAFALALTGRGDVLLAEPEARAICSIVSEQLRTAGQIAAPPEPSLILASLAAHHLLERVGYPAPTFRFEHQQFQEYYVAIALRDVLVAAISSNDPSQRHAFASSYLNVPAWEEPLEMLADDLGDGDQDVALGRALVEGALPIDPVFAACLAGLSGAPVWAEVRVALHKRLRSLYGSSDAYDQECAVAAMLATGSEEFADVIVPRLISADPQVRHATYRAGPGFYPSSVGVHWQTVVASWPEQLRIEFMSRLTFDREYLEIASTLARIDPSAVVRVEAIRLLAWMGQGDEVADLLRSLPDAEFVQAIDMTELDELPSQLRDRALAIYTSRLAQSDDAKVRFQLGLTLANHGDPQGIAQLKDVLTNQSAVLVREVSDFSLHQAVGIIFESDPPWVSEWVARGIVDGALWQDEWMGFVSEVPKPLREEWFRRTATEEIEQGGTVSVLASTADAAFAQCAFEALREQRRSLQANPRNEHEQTLERQLAGLVRKIPLPVLVEGLLTMLADDPRDEDVDVVISVVGESQRAHEPEVAPLPEASREQLRRYLKSAVATVLAREDFRGSAKAYLATALAEVGHADDIDDLLVLLRADIERVRSGRRPLRDGHRTPQSDGATMGWAQYHVQAVLRLDPVGAEPILSDLLQEPEYEQDAAWALRDLARKEPSNRRTSGGRFFGAPNQDYRSVRRTPREWMVLFDADRRVKYAAAIRERITHLLVESRRDPASVRESHWRAKELVKPLAALDPNDSADLIIEVAALPLTIGWAPIGLMEALVFGGVTLTADQALALIEPVVDRLRTHGKYNDNAGLVLHIACLLPFVDPPVRGVVRVRELLAEFPLASYEQRDLLSALGQCSDEEGLVLLCEIARGDGAQFQYVAREWLAAVAASPYPRARQLLLSFVDPEVEQGVADIALPDDALDMLAGTLADVARRDRKVAERMSELCDKSTSPPARVVLAKVAAQLGTAEALLTALNLIDDAAEPPIPYGLSDALEGVFLEKRPSAEIANAYGLVPRAASDVRARLFELATHDQRRCASASRLLARIEAWRLEHGRPASEPRHPAYDSGTEWPLPAAAEEGPPQ